MSYVKYHIKKKTTTTNLSLFLKIKYEFTSAVLVECLTLSLTPEQTPVVKGRLLTGANPDQNQAHHEPAHVLDPTGPAWS